MGREAERDEFEVVPTADGFDVVDQAVGLPLLRVNWTLDVSASAGPALGLMPTALQAVLEGSASQMPGLIDSLERAPVLRVEFTKATMDGLRDGSLRLMTRGADQLADAVEADSGRVVEKGRVIGNAAKRQSRFAGVGPSLLASGAGIVAAYAERAWLEEQFSAIRSTLDRLEDRLRDDDRGTLEAADALTDAIGVGPSSIPAQHRIELAHARMEVERVYRSRRRYVARIITQMTEEQTAHESVKGERKSWVGEAAHDLASPESDTFEEVTIYLHAMIVRARLAVATALVLAEDGDGIVALRLIDETRASTRTDFSGLFNRVNALANYGPDASALARVPLAGRFLTRRDAQAHQRIVRLRDDMVPVRNRVLEDPDAATVKFDGREGLSRTEGSHP